MIRYLVRRLLGAVPLVLGVATIIFFAVNLAPGDPAMLLVPPGASDDAAEVIRERLGLNDPVPVRYVKWMGSVLRGDFGQSFQQGRPALDVMMDFLPMTLLLSGTALLIAFLFGIVLGTIQAVRQYSLLDSTLSVVTLFFYSMPSFWLAIMMVLVFGYLAAAVLGPEWALPVSGAGSPLYDFMEPGEQFRNRLAHLILPATSLALVITAGVARYMRGSMLEVIRQDFVRTARAKGLPESRVVFKHALRNALLPIITLFGLYLPVIFSGTVFIEVVFSWPGIGRMIVDSIDTRDFPLIMVGSFFFACMVVVGNLIADVLYAVVDPRIRYD